MNEISNNDDIIDGRAVHRRIDELTRMLDDAREDFSEEYEASTVDQHMADVYGDEMADLAALKGIADESDRDSTLIRDSHFETYAQEFAEDIGAIQRGMAWPCNCIDWAKAARELQQDYASVDFDGVTYWVRS